MICYFKGPYFVGVIITRTAFWLPVIIVHIHNFLTVIFYCYINVCTILKRFSIKKTALGSIAQAAARNVSHLPVTSWSQ